MTRRPVLVMATLVLLAAAAVGAIALTRDDERAAAAPPNEARADGLTLIVVRAPGGPFAAVVGSTGGPDGALVVPADTHITIPGQGEGTVAEALQLPLDQASTAVANLLGVWIDHDAALGADRLAALVDRSGGVTVGDELLKGQDVAAMLRDAGDGATAAFELVARGLLEANLAWAPSDLAEADAPSVVAQSLRAAAGAPVASLPLTEASNGIAQADPDQTRAALVEVFGGPDRPVVGVIVLNGSGVPGVGELVAQRIVPGGFRVVVSENASTFDHRETLVVVGSADDVALGERVRDLLGTGSVNVSVSSGIAPVTVVVGRDFEG